MEKQEIISSLYKVEIYHKEKKEWNTYNLTTSLKEVKSDYKYLLIYFEKKHIRIYQTNTVLIKHQDLTTL